VPGGERFPGGLDELEGAVGGGAGVLVGVHEEAEPAVLPLDVVVGDVGRRPQAQHGVAAPGGAPSPRRGGVHVVGRRDPRRAGEPRREPDRGLHPLPRAVDVARQEALLGERLRPAGLLLLVLAAGGVVRHGCRCACARARRIGGAGVRHTGLLDVSRVAGVDL